jgi:hypothetical protein
MSMTTYGGAVRALQPIISTVFRSLDEGLQEAQQYHTTKLYQRRDDPHFYLHAARRHACTVLEEEGLSASLVDETAKLNMSGILVQHRGFALRILHTQQDPKGKVQLPIPGRSKQRQGFWRQESPIPGLETDNLLLLWLDVEGALVDPMILLRPLGGDHRRGTLRLEWRGKVSREMTKLQAEDLDALEPDWQVGRLA